MILPVYKDQYKGLFAKIGVVESKQAQQEILELDIQKKDEMTLHNYVATKTARAKPRKKYSSIYDFAQIDSSSNSNSVVGECKRTPDIAIEIHSPDPGSLSTSASILPPPSEKKPKIFSQCLVVMPQGKISLMPLRHCM